MIIESLNFETFSCFLSYCITSNGGQTKDEKLIAFYTANIFDRIMIKLQPMVVPVLPFPGSSHWYRESPLSTVSLSTVPGKFSTVFNQY